VEVRGCRVNQRDNTSVTLRCNIQSVPERNVLITYIVHSEDIDYSIEP
jgi:hypothetical protein